MRTSFYAILACSVLSLAACTPVADTSVVDNGKVLKVGKEKLILQGSSNIMFLDISETDREQLKTLKTGEKVKLLGKTETITAENGRKITSSEINVLIRENGTRITLGD